MSVVLNSCQRYLNSRGSSFCCAIDENALLEFSNSIDEKEFNSLSRPFTSFPLKFDSLEQEVNLLAVYHLLNIGVGFSSFFHNSSWEDILCCGIISFYISPQISGDSYSLSALSLKNISYSDVAEHFNLCVDKICSVPTLPGVEITKPGPLAQLCNFLTRSLQETGDNLLKSGYKSLGVFIFDQIKYIKNDKGQPSASLLVEKLCAFLPAFMDFDKESSDETVYFYKNAQALVLSLYCKLGDSWPDFNFFDINKLSCFSDLSLASVLIQKSIIKKSFGATEELNQSEVSDLRAASVLVCERISKAVHFKTANQCQTGIFCLKSFSNEYICGKFTKSPFC